MQVLLELKKKVIQIQIEIVIIVLSFSTIIVHGQTIALAKEIISNFFSYLVKMKVLQKNRYFVVYIFNLTLLAIVEAIGFLMIVSNQTQEQFLENDSSYSGIEFEGAFLIIVILLLVFILMVSCCLFCLCSFHVILILRFILFFEY